MKDLLVTPSWETLSAHWKKEILTEIIHVWKDDPRQSTNLRQMCGVLLDPKDFFPKYMTRFLMRMEKEGNPVPPGSFDVEAKVIFCLKNLWHKIYGS